MRAIWKGAVAFGLVNVPVKLYAATGERDVPLHQVHKTDGGRIRYRRVCSIEDEPVEYSDIAKGYETEDGRLVILTEEDLDQLPLATEREIEVIEFVPSDQVDPILLAKTYYLEPDTTAAKPYALLREALTSTERMAVVKVALRQRESMAVLRVRDDVICLQTLLWPDEVREADFPILDSDVAVRPQELAMASSLVESLAADWDPSGFEDRYRAALEAMIEAKVNAGRTQSVPTPAETEADGGKPGRSSTCSRHCNAAWRRRGRPAARRRPSPRPRPARTGGRPGRRPDRGERRSRPGPRHRQHRRRAARRRHPSPPPPRAAPLPRPRPRPTSSLARPPRPSRHVPGVSGRPDP